MVKAAIIDDVTTYIRYKFTPLNLRRLHMKFEGLVISEETNYFNILMGLQYRRH